MCSTLPVMLDHNKDIVRGALHIIDHAGERPSGTTKREFQNSTIEAHLQNQTYYHESSRGRVRADAETMLGVFKNLYFHEGCSDAVTRAFYACQTGEDHADTFFRIGSDKLPPKFLDSYGYKKSTFSENELPDYTLPSAPTKRGAASQWSPIQRSFWTVIQDIDATRGSRDHAKYKYRNKQSQHEALEVLIRDFQLEYATQGSGYGDRKPCTSEKLHKTFSRAWTTRKVKATATNASLWVSGISDWDPVYIDLIRRNCDELSAHESLPIYDRAAATSLSADFVVQDDDSVEASQDGEAVEESGGSKDVDETMTVPGAEINDESSSSDDDDESVHDVRASKPADISATSAVVVLPMPKPLESAQEAELREAQADARRATTTSTISTLSTEQTISVSPDEDARHLSDSHPETSDSPPVERKRRRISLDTPTSPKRQRAENPQGKASVSALRSGEEAQDVVADWVSRRLEDNSRKSIDDNAHKSTSALRQDPDQPPQRHRLPERQGLMALNLSQLEAGLEHIYFKLLTASCQLMESVGEVDQEAMPLEQNAPPSTLELHVRCWGTEWRQVRHSLKKSHLLSVPDVVLSLCSAYLFDKVLDCKISDTQVGLKFDGKLASGSVGDKDTMKKIHALIAQDSDYQACLKKHAVTLAEELWVAIVPHIKRLALEAESHDLLREGTNESTWRQSFEPAITGAIHHALRFRLMLMGTDCEYSFTWPHARQEFDPKTMQNKVGGSSDLAAARAVAFTLFPGLEVSAPDLNGGQAEPACRAVVKLLSVSDGQT